MTISSARRLTADHCFNHPCVRVAELRAQDGVPDGYEAVGLEALAARLHVSRVTAWRRMQTISARQRDPSQLRVVRLPVAIGSGAKRLALHVLWPLSVRAPPDQAALLRGSGAVAYTTDHEHAEQSI